MSARLLGPILAAAGALAACSSSGSPDTSGAGGAGGAASASSSGAGGSIAPAGGPVLYTGGRRHAPVTAELADRWRAFVTASGRAPRSFIRVGDNLSHAVHLLGCAAKPADRDLGTHGSLLGTIDHFAKGSVGGTNPFEHARDFENVTVWTALEGDPSLVDDEIAAGDPAYALVMFGTLDAIWNASSEASRADDPEVVKRFGPKLLELTDLLLDRGVLPLLRTIPPFGASNQGPWTARVALMNGVVRAVAQARQVPFADFHADAKELDPTIAYWSDGYHLETAPQGACQFTAEGLAYGDDLMSLVTLESLDRVKRAVVDGEAPDAIAPALGGEGTEAAPFEVPGIPFADVREIEAGATGKRSSYVGYQGGDAETGPEHVYRVVLDAPALVRAFVFDRAGGGVDTVVHHFAGSLEDASCRSSNTALLELALDAGTHYFVIDGPSGGASEFVFGLAPCDDGDATCIAD